MGNRKSIAVQADEQSSIHEIVKCMMPLYYHREPVTEESINIASDSWNLILDGSDQKMLERPDMIGTRPNPFPEGAPGFTRFREQFFYRYFDVQPEVERMFSRESVESGPFLGSMIDTCLTQLKDPKGFREKMVKLAVDHIRRGVWAIQYGIVGEVLFWSLRRCLGPSYSREIETAWKIVFSSILTIMVPIAVFYEKKIATSLMNESYTKMSSRAALKDDDDETILLAASVVIR